jgi:hypothetical protein
MTATPTEKIQKLASKLRKYHRQLSGQRCSQGTILKRLRRMTSEIELCYLIPDKSNEEVLEEVRIREISCLPRVSDESLLQEVERRGLPIVRSTLAKDEFEKEARTRGYKRFLSEFPRSEITSYLKVQGLG